MLIYSLLPFLSGCTKVRIKSDFAKLQHKTQLAINASIVLDNTSHTNLENLLGAQDAFDYVISKTEAIRLALLNNPGLQADFQNLGIAKADLVQAGLYTNPKIKSVFCFATDDRGPGTTQTNIEAMATMRLSDLWQVPLSKHIAEDVLEIVSLRILSTILTIVEDTKIAYETCVIANLRAQNTKGLLQAARELQDEIYYRQGYGYTSDWDKDASDARVGMLEAEVKKQEAYVVQAYLKLKQLMGLRPSTSSIKVVDQFDTALTIPEFEVIETCAIEHRPEIQIAHMKIKQYQDQIRAEKAKIVKVVEAGIVYKQDFEKPFAGWGPYFNISLPIFDDNHAQIARAEFLLKQAEQKLIEEKITILTELHTSYYSLQALRQEIAQYENIVLPSQQKIVDYAYHYTESMQLNMVIALESEMKLYENTAQLLDKYYHALKELAHLERSAGRDFNLFPVNKPLT